MTPPPMNHLHTILSRATGLDAAALIVKERPALAYQSNRLYDVWADDRHLIAKEYLRPDELAVAPACEFNALHRLAELDVAPQPVFYDPALGPVVVYAYMAGEMWNRKRPSPAQLRQLAELWLQITALPVDGLWLSRGHDASPMELAARFRAWLQTYRAWSVAHYPPAVPLADLSLDVLQTRQPLFASLERLPATLRFCRSDNRFANVIARPDGRLGLVDWEDSGLRDPACDVADLLTHANQEDLLDEQDWRPFLDHYLPFHQAADAAFAERLHGYLTIFPLFWLALLLNAGLRKAQTGALPGWEINEMPANERLRRYLARALAWPDAAFDSHLASLPARRFFP
jgi:aminoglycoside phosphotransferase (APT) family kinase protein